MMIAGEVDGVTIEREWIFQGQYLRAYCDNPTCNRARVNFDHRRAGRTDFDEPTLLAGAVRHGYASLIVQSAANDYYLNPDLPDMRRALRAYVKRFHDISAMGFSMGGFAALLLSRALNLSYLWLISPMSPNIPKTAPFFPDPAAEVDIFAAYGPKRLQGVAPNMRGVVVFDPYFEAGRDRSYAEFVQKLCPKIALLALPWGGHPATQFLSEIQNYSPLLRTTFRPQITAKPMKKVQRKFRLQSDRYREALQDYLRQRADRISEK